jgi:tRNA dimethylallyltransferase
MKRIALLIAGPTGVGKSNVAAQVAARLNGEIINADSMQVYADLSILSARPAVDFISSIPHHLFGFVDGCETYGLGNWLPDATQAVNRIQTNNHIPIIVGGTGLYLSAIERGYVPKIRTIVSADNDGADDLGPGWLRRGSFLRSPPSSLRGEGYVPADLVFKFVLERPREELHSRINSNFENMVLQGAIEEVERLVSRRLDSHQPIMKALGVRELAAYLGNELTLNEAILLGQANSRKFARRQMTWFRNQMAGWQFISAEDGGETILSIVRRALP